MHSAARVQLRSQTRRRKLKGKVFTTRTFPGSRVVSPVITNNGPPKNLKTQPKRVTLGNCRLPIQPGH